MRGPILTLTSLLVTSLASAQTIRVNEPSGRGLGRLRNFVVAWQSHVQDGSNWGVFGQRYGQIVPVELMHVRVE